jgi:hypothetical protein
MLYCWCLPWCRCRWLVWIPIYVLIHEYPCSTADAFPHANADGWSEYWCPIANGCPLMPTPHPDADAIPNRAADACIWCQFIA